MLLLFFKLKTVMLDYRPAKAVPSWRVFHGESFLITWSQIRLITWAWRLYIFFIV
jgi:hypothetical protein